MVISKGMCDFVPNIVGQLNLQECATRLFIQIWAEITAIASVHDSIIYKKQGSGSCRIV
jgi:hypothetical protein